MCDLWRAHNYSLVGAIFRLEGNDQQWQVVRMASSGLGPRQLPQIMAVPFPSLGPTTPTTLDPTSPIWPPVATPPAGFGLDCQ